jgi:hypothetical protein
VSITGNNRADLRFGRDTLTLAVGANAGPPAPWNGLILNTNGNLGIGMAALAPDSIWRLEVNGLTRITPIGAAGGAIQFSTPDAETGMSILGRNRGDVRFDDTTLKLVAGPGNGPPRATPAASPSTRRGGSESGPRIPGAPCMSPAAASRSPGSAALSSAPEPASSSSTSPTRAGRCSPTTTPPGRPGTSC